MAEIIRMPRLSDTMEEGNIVSWQKKVGDKVEPGDILAEVETDKATMDLESFNDGVLLYIGVEQGPVPVEGVIAIIGNAGEDISELLAQVAQESAGSNSTNNTAAQTEPKEVKSEPAKASTPVVSSKPAQVSAPNHSNNDGRLKASPLAKKMAEDSGIDLARVTGTGESGRIIKRDIDDAIKNGIPASSGSSSSMALQSNLDPELYGDKPLSQMRKVIAKRLSQSKFSAPHFYLTIEINMDKAIAARKVINEDASVRISFNDMVVKASAAALRKHPAINSSWFDDKITYHKDINIGIAVAIDDGLMVPVVNNCDLKSLTMIKSEIKVLAGKAKERKLSPDEMSGNTFTISNLGMFDIDEFTAIINPPDACILAVGSIVEKPIVKNSEIVVGNMMKVTLSCDHRVVDGAKGASFLQTLKAFLENPVKLLA